MKRLRIEQKVRVMDILAPNDMIEIDGSQGEGGGQIVRSSLALSAVTNTPLRLFNIRAGRKKSGLLRQHLTAARAAAQVCDGKIEGDEIGASEIQLHPKKINPGDFHFKVGTAGSTTLIAQTVLPPLMLGERTSTVTIEGGTHNPWAPPYDFLDRTFLPLLARMGPSVSATLESHGFYPAGGGKIVLRIDPQQQLKGLSIVQPISDVEPSVTSVVAGIPKSIGDRECETIRRKTNWPPKQFQVSEVQDSISPGNIVLIELDSQQVTEVFSGIGRTGIKAEHVARNTLRDARKYLAEGHPVGPHLADQLMLPMGIAASQGQPSSFRTGRLTQHSRTHIDVLNQFLDIQLSVEENESETLVSFQPKHGH